MIWDDPDDSEHTQRLKNGIFLKMWVKNDTRDRAVPIMGFMIAVLVVIGIGIYLFT